MTNDSGTLMWDFTIATDGPVAHNHPDITLVDKFSGAVKFIDIAVPGDCRLRSKILEKKEKYTDLCIKVQRMWKSSTSVVPVVIGALGSIPSDLAETLLLIGLDKQIIPVLQKTVLLSTYRILRLSYCCMFLPIVPGWYWDCVPDCHCICEFIR